jgi:tetratricopeptide (TPR) repeat protein
MPTTHRKLHRKDLKQPDEFQTFFENLRDFTLANLTRIIVAGVAVVVLVVAAGGIYLFERHRERAVASQFYEALTALDASRYKAAEGEFLNLAESEPGFRLGRLARFYLASAYIAQNDNARARGALLSYLARDDDPLFRSLALNELAVVYENMGDFKKAGAAYHEAAGIPGPEQTRAEIGAARMLAREGNDAAAVAAYRTFLKDHPFAREQNEVTQALAALGASPEAEKQAAKPSEKTGEKGAEKTAAAKTPKAPPAAPQAAGSPKTAAKPGPPANQGASKPPAPGPSSK